MIMLKPALKYYGGKWRLAPWIIRHFPSHKSYVEPCGGAASVLLQKPVSPLETYNDLDKHVVNFFQVLRDTPEALKELIRLTPYAREEFERCRAPVEDPLENARRFFVSSWLSISCMAFDKAQGFRTESYYGQAYGSVTKSAHNTEESLLAIAERLRYVQIECRPYDYIILRYDSENTLIYFDPPYVQKTRTIKNQYVYEWDDAEHRKAAELLRQVKGYVIISGYACPLYTELYEEHEWERRDIKSQVNGSHKLRIESLWLSPKTSEALQLPINMEFNFKSISHQPHPAATPDFSSRPEDVRT